MVDFTYPQLNADQGSQTANTLRNVANSAADVVCSLYKHAPTGIIPQFGDVLGVGQFTQGLLSNLCDDRNMKPPDPVKPFQGGQCQNVTYSVSYVARYDGVPAGTGQVTLVGKIGAPIVTQTGGNNSYRFYQGVIPHRDGEFVAFSGAGGLNGGQTPAELTITSIVRPDGLPDNCGSLPSRYPTRDPQPEDYETTKTVKQPGGNIQVPVVIIPVFAPITNIFRPEINVDVGGISVTFDIEGVHFHLNVGVDRPPVLPPSDPRIVKPPTTQPKSPSSRGEGYDFSKIYKELADIKACACGTSGSLSTVTYGLAKGRKITLPQKALYVEITIEVGSAVRYQVSEGDCPDVYFVGWCAFGIASNFGTRVPVSFEGNAFGVPEGATHFTYSLVFDSRASLKVYHET